MSEWTKPKSCYNCGHFSGAPYEYPEEGDECRELPDVIFLKNWPFKNGCKRWTPPIWHDFDPARFEYPREGGIIEARK